MPAKAINKKEALEAIINKCDVCYLGLANENEPYVLPFNFGYKNDYIYLHSAPEGKKIEILKKNPKVCIAFSTDHKLAFRSENMACSYHMKFKSVLAYGVVEFIDDYDQKIEVLNIVMEKYTGRTFDYNAPAINNVAIFRVKVEEMTGKEDY